MIAREFFCAVPTGPPPALPCGSKGKMSREKGIFQEKHSPQKKNVPEIATKRGGNHRAKKNVPENATIRGGNLSQQQNILILPPNCGGNDHAKKNVLENATKRGENTTAE